MTQLATETSDYSQLRKLPLQESHILLIHRFTHERIMLSLRISVIKIIGHSRWWGAVANTVPVWVRHCNTWIHYANLTAAAMAAAAAAVVDRFQWSLHSIVGPAWLDNTDITLDGQRFRADRRQTALRTTARSNTLTTIITYVFHSTYSSCDSISATGLRVPFSELM